jgi:hypothetical protein
MHALNVASGKDVDDLTDPCTHNEYSCADQDRIVAQKSACKWQSHMRISFPATTKQQLDT